jgi:phosphoribosylamine--glycine ligase
MKVLVVGGGGREHALAWKLARDKSVSEVLCAPGNPGIRQIATTIDVQASDVDALAALAEREHVDLTVVGPEAPLDRGLVDLFTSRGLVAFGPTRAAAQLECSKVFAKAFMSRHGIPTAGYRACSTADEARAVIRSGELGFPIVVKADGLAAGKGVVVAPTAAEAEAAVRAAMEDRQFGDAGTHVVLEECLEGPEVSFFAIADGTRALPLPSAQDHKRIFDDDRGPNTGGMGAFAPSPLMDSAMHDRVMRDIVSPVLAGMRADGHEYRGFLYAGLMLTCAGPKVIEFNVRFGDPEAQVVMPLIADDLAPVLEQAAQGALGSSRIALHPRVSVGVVLASGGYPGPVTTGDAIHGADASAVISDTIVFHAGTAEKDGRVVTAGGRVLTVVATADDYPEAIARAYDRVASISFNGMQYRRDIGRKAVSVRHA